jgi:Sulfotransferase domain
VRPATLMLKAEYAYFHCDSAESFDANAKRTYCDHYAAVRKAVPERRLLDGGLPEGVLVGRRLEYELGSGWEPLCAFLGNDVPRRKDGGVVEFPWMNEGKEFEVWMRRIQERELKRASGLLVNKLLAPGAVGVVAWAAWLLVSS